LSNTGETNLIGAEGATTPETLRQKGPYIITLESRLCLTEGVNLSGTWTEGVK